MATDKTDCSYSASKKFVSDQRYELDKKIVGGILRGERHWLKKQSNLDEIELEALGRLVQREKEYTDLAEVERNCAENLEKECVKLRLLLDAYVEHLKAGDALRVSIVENCGV